MNLAAIIHRPSTAYIYPSSRNTLEVQLITAREDAEEVELLYWLRYETDPARIKRKRVGVSLRDALRDYYRTTIHMEGIAAYVRYFYRLKSGDTEVWLGAKGILHSQPTMNEGYFEFLWPNADDGFGLPPWHERQVYYQIFPERFRKGSGVSPPGALDPWGSPPTRENFMGGNIPGILEKLDYISSLGATCLYLTPIFRAPSNHKYDTIDYFEIDPGFGTKQDFRKLVEEVHRRGMRIILDGVFNHCGYYWSKFQDVVQKGKTSEYSDWFFIHKYPISADDRNYDCVGHYRWMPKINLSNPKARDYFLSVGKYWLREFKIDGWRLDVADELPTSFLEAFAAAMREEKADCILLGETWGDAERLVMGNRLDSAMNYLFRDALVLWLAEQKVSVTEFDHLLNSSLALYPEEIAHRMYNLLDSHDTARFLYECGGDKKRLKLAVALQMTYPGCPAIFYGDEIGLSAENDPGCRLAMEWEESKQDTELYRWYQRLISIRMRSDALVSGDFQTVFCDDGANVYGFSRTVAGEQSLVLLNAGVKAWNGTASIPVWALKITEITLDSKTGSIQTIDYPRTTVLTAYQGNFDVELPAYSVKIYHFISKEKEQL
ncbi:MAG: alpha amylase N-terminal ig-like domain-containing protein [Firmicutes bacterium]|nr:alpha amylase N-terminal ig-like domain-containing protein [Bacillota bacterium]